MMKIENQEGFRAEKGPRGDRCPSRAVLSLD